MERKRVSPIEKQEIITEKPKPQRRKRVNVDGNTELVLVNNNFGAYYYEHPRMTTVIDMEKYGDETYVTVADLRVIVNSSRKVLEGFKLLITEVVDENYELVDVISYLGLDKAYAEYFTMNPKDRQDTVSLDDISEFIKKAPVSKFESVLEEVDEKLVLKIIETAVAMFKIGEFGDYRKMQIMRDFTSDDLFNDAEETEISEEVTNI